MGLWQTYFLENRYSGAGLFQVRRRGSMLLFLTGLWGSAGAGLLLLVNNFKNIAGAGLLILAYVFKLIAGARLLISSMFSRLEMQGGEQNRAQA